MGVLVKLMKIIVGIGITGLLPLYFITIFLTYVYFGFVNLLAKYFRKDFAYSVRRLDAYLSSDKIQNKPSCTLVHVTVLKGSPSEETVINHLEQLYESRSKEGSRIYEKLGFSLERWMGYSFWKKINNFRIRDYVHFIKTEEQLDRVGIGGFIEKVIRAPIKKDAPLWEVFVLYPPNSKNMHRKRKLCDGNGNTEGWSEKLKLEGKYIEELQKGKILEGEYLQDPSFPDSNVTAEGSPNCDNEGECFIVFKTHHMLLDGMCLVKLWFKADGAEQLPSNLMNIKTLEKGQEGEGTKYKNWVKCLQLLFVTPYICNPFLTPHDGNYFMKQYKDLDGDWFCSGINKIYVERYRGHLRKVGFSLTHAVLVAYTRGFRRFLQGNYSPSQIPEKIHIVGSIPVPNYPNHPDNTLVNHWTIMRYKAVLSIDEIKGELQRAKEQYAVAVRSFIPQSFYLLSGVFEKTPRVFFDNTFDERKHTTLALSNIPGPQTEQRMLNLPVSDRMVWLPLTKHSSGIGLLFLTYNGWGNISLTVDTGLIKSRKLFEELNSFIALEMQVVLDEVERMSVSMDLSTSSAVKNEALYEIKVVK